jgi:putative oxygen-independent coproporphyrinogen III oxidase
VARGSVYVHFPWCLAKCPYCDFVSYAAPREAIDHVRYAGAILRELEARSARFLERGVVVGSVFFGGGTPSLWDPVELGRVLAGIRETLPCSTDLEVTVECNPSSLDRDRAARLHDAGVGRLSIGAQSLRADELAFLGRLHDPEGARAALRGAIDAGVPRVSADMIFGLPGQTPGDACAQALELADLGLAHLSCYQLTIEPNTQFGELARRGRLPLADDGLVAEAFLAIDEALGREGFGHYEISNYARPGEEARHNLGYWRGEEYLGLGCAAWGFVRTKSGGLRYRNVVDPERYLAATKEIDAGRVWDERTLANAREPLDGEALLRERIMLGLRLAEGFDLEASASELGVDPWPAARRRVADGLASRGRLKIDGPRLSIPRGAWLWTDDTAARLF